MYVLHIFTFPASFVPHLKFLGIKKLGLFNKKR